MARFETLRRWIRRWFMFVGIVTSILVLIAVIVIIAVARRAPAVPAATILELPLDGPLVERPDPNPLMGLLGRQPLTLRNVVEALERARDDTRVVGVIAYFGGTNHGMAATQEIRDAVIRFRESGKPAVAFADTFGEVGPGNQAYYLATAFDEIWLQPSGDLGLTGLIVDEPFLKGTLDLLDIKIRGDHRKEYKTALNHFTQKGFTDAHREASAALAGDLFRQMVDAIATRKQSSPDDVRRLIDQGPFLAQAALGEKLVDRLGYRDELLADLRARVGEDARLLYAEPYLSRAGGMHTRGTRMALIYGIGPVRRGTEQVVPLFASAGLSAREVTAAFRAAVADPDVKAILFRVSSPGGSYVASDAILREVTAARAAGKPVIVSMGNVAASGGYFVAMNATKIVAEPGTLTGSIGVVRIKPVLRDFWGKLGVSWDSVATSRNAEMWSAQHDYDEAEWQHVQAWLDRVYEDFTGKVAQGRGLAPSAVEQAAKGRVWTGAQAKELGLIDELGGYSRAIALAREATGLAPDAPVELVEYPRRPDWLSRLRAEPPESSESEGAASIGLEAALVDEGDLVARLRQVLRAAELASPRGPLSMPALEVRP